MKTQELLESLRRLESQLTHGCGNHGCRIKEPTGMGTNATCQCTPRGIARTLRNLADYVESPAFLGKEDFLKITAPFTAETVAALNRWQQTPWVHPFTCGNDNCLGDDDRVLVATAKGWICPACTYKQDWAWEFMLRTPPRLGDPRLQMDNKVGPTLSHQPGQD